MPRSCRGASTFCSLLSVFLMMVPALTAFAADETAAPGRSLLVLADAAPAPASAPSAPVVSGGPNPGIAISLAVLPGIAVHGSGHFYAGRPLTGAALVAAELGSLYLMYRGGTGVMNAFHNGVLDPNSQGFGRSEEFSRGVGLAAGGLMIFVASWLYDVTGAPVAAAETAAALQKTAPQSTQVGPQVQGDRVALVLERRF